MGVFSGGDVDVERFECFDVDLDGENDDDVINLSDEEDYVPDEIKVSAINVTLYKTEKFKDGELCSVSRTASVGYTENISPLDIGDSLPSIFSHISREFNIYARHYQS